MLDTTELVRAHYNGQLELAGVVVNRCERTVEHRQGSAEIERYFGESIAWQPYLAKCTVLQDAIRRGTPVHRLSGRPAAEAGEAFARLARRLESARVVG